MISEFSPDKHNRNRKGPKVNEDDTDENTRQLNEQSEDEFCFEKLEKELKKEITEKLSFPAQTGRTRAQRMVHVPIISNLSLNPTEEKKEELQPLRTTQQTSEATSQQFGDVKSNRNMEQGDCRPH